MRYRYYLPALLLLVFGTLWILTTDELLRVITGNEQLEEYQNLQTIKGLVFVVTISLLAFFSYRIIYRQTDQGFKLYRRLYDDNPSPMWIYDEETLQFLSVNKSAIEKYGYSFRDFKKMTILDIIPEGERPALEDHLSRLEDDNYSKHIWTHRTKEGKDYQVRVRSFPIYYRKRRARLLVMHNVTDILEAREREQRYLKDMRFQDAQLNAVMNNTDDLIWSVDGALRFIVMNAGLREAVKRIIGAAIEPGTSALIPEMPERDKLFWTEMYKTVLAGKTMRFEEEVLQPDGDSIWYSVSMKPIRDEQGQVHGISCYARNVSDFKRNIGQLSRQNNRLREIAFISAHELRKPVANILGLATLAEKGSRAGDLDLILNHISTSAAELDGNLHKIIHKTEMLEAV